MDGPLLVLSLLRFRVVAILSIVLCLSMVGKLDPDGGEASAVRSTYPELFRADTRPGEA